MDDDTTPRKELTISDEEAPIDPEAFPILQPFPDMDAVADVVNNRRGAKKHHPTPETRQLVSNMLVCGIPPEVVARVFGIAKGTLERLYPNEIETSEALATSQLASRVYERAMNGNDKSSAILAMFWLKARAGWRDQGPVQDNSEGEDYEVTEIRETLIRRVKTAKKSDNTTFDQDNAIDVTPEED